MIKVRKYCMCGVKLERDASDEDQARRLLELFYLEHAGTGHGRATPQQYRQVISKIIARNARSNRPKEVMPVISAIENAGDLGSFGYCAVCFAVKGPTAHECKGAALMIREPVLVRN